MTVQFWVLTGLVYVVLLFATGAWDRLVPTSWSMVVLHGVGGEFSATALAREDQRYYATDAGV